MNRPENFRDYPKSVKEIRAAKSDEWEVRDALINILRSIDSGEINPKNVLILMEHEDGMEYSTAGASTGEAISMMAQVMYLMNRRMFGHDQ